MTVYQWLGLARRIRAPRIKLLGLWWLHITGRRYIGIFLDPVLGCNLRCQMCYFSDPERRKQLHGTLTPTQLERLAGALFHRALKLQIGCGAEPTLYRHLIDLVRLGQKYHVPFISMTTNGQLLNKPLLEDLFAAGLNELTLSLHGTTKETYERLMQGADFAILKGLLNTLRELASENTAWRVRINYTINEDNMDEMSSLLQLLEGVPVNVLQLRPIQKIGESAYQNFSVQAMLTHYDRLFPPLVEACRERGITCLYPTRENFEVLMHGESGIGDATSGNPIELMFQEFAYCNITPWAQWHNDFDLEKDTFETFCRRNHRARSIFKQIISPSHKRDSHFLTKQLNYNIK